MATGIVAIGMSRIRVTAISEPLLVVASAIWLCLLAATAVRLSADPRELGSELSSPAALTLVAATAVLGTAAAGLGWVIPAAGLLLLAIALLGLVLVPVLRRWQTPTRGLSFLLPVAVASISVAAAALSGSTQARWLVVPAVGAWGLALAAYLFVVIRFDFRELLRGRGDHWVAGGALAIATLAGGEVCLRLRLSGNSLSLSWEMAVVVLWAAASAGIGGLLVGELASPRAGHHHLRWATVFPLGMYGVCSLVLGSVTGMAALLTLGRVFVWVGFGAWLLVAAALLLRGLALGMSWPDSHQAGGG